MGLSEAEFIELEERMRRNAGRSGLAQLAIPPTPDVLEAPIQQECTKLLEADGWRALRTDPVSDRSRGKGFGEVGMADMLYIRYRPSDPNDHWIVGSYTCELVWVEYKRGRGGVVKKTQRAWHTKERARGALTLIAGEDFAPSVEGFRMWYQNSGLQRRKDL